MWRTSFGRELKAKCWASWLLVSFEWNLQSIAFIRLTRIRIKGFRVTSGVLALCLAINLCGITGDCLGAGEWAIAVVASESDLRGWLQDLCFLPSLDCHSITSSVGSGLGLEVILFELLQLLRDFSLVSLPNRWNGKACILAL